MAYHHPRTLPELEQALAAGGPDTLVLAGGTDLMVRARDAVRERVVVDVTRVAELRRVELRGGELVLGAGVTWAECLTDPVIRRACPLLPQVAERFASPPIREVATLGGNVANASPAGDGLTALWVLDALVEALTPAGPARRPLHEVVLGPGRLGLPPGSVLTALRVPAAVRSEASAFYKLTNRAWPEHPMAIAVASVAVRLRLDGEGRVKLARIALGAVAPTPVRAGAAETVLIGSLPRPACLEEAAAAAVAAAQPRSDVRASAEYRRAVLPALVTAALETAARAARPPEIHRV